MCSINEIEQASNSTKAKKGATRRDKENSKHFAGEGSCMKCPEKAVVLVRNNDPFCKACFLDYTVHKFRATIGKARVIHHGQRVLLAVSGGSASSAMLDLVIKGLSKATIRKHRFQPGVVHVDDEGLCGQSANDRDNIKHHIEELTRNAGFPYYSVSLADLFMHQDTCIEINSQDLDISSEKQNISSEISKGLIGLFEKVTTVTAQEDLLLHLYRNVLQKIAKDHGYDYIMVGDCGTNNAVRILADIAQGRGSQLPFNVGFKDSRSEVLVLRPMCEFTNKEIQFYNYFNNVTSFTIPSFTTKAQSHGSINRLTEELIIGLQAGFPSTISTVLKTGDKISSNVDSGNTVHCALCLAPLAVYSGFSEEFRELSLCGSGDCGRAEGCQESGRDSAIGCQKDDESGDMHTGNDGINRIGCQNSDGGDDIASADTDGSSDILKCTSGVDGGSLRGSMLNSNGGTLSGGGGWSSTRSSGSDGTLRDGSCTHVDKNMNDHNIVMKSLCYGCKLTYHDIRDGQMLLPKFVTENSTKQFQEKTRKDQIQDFLLH